MVCMLRRFRVTEENRFAEYFVDLLGPPVHWADDLLRRALDIHFKSKTWHFTTNAFLPWSATANDSKALLSLKNEKPRFMFSVKVIFMITFIFEIFKTKLRDSVTSLWYGKHLPNYAGYKIYTSL